MSAPVEHRPGPHVSPGLSRRRALSGLAASGLGLALAGPRLGVAQEASGAIPDIIQRFADAQSSDDPATALDALYADDAIYEDVPTLTQSEPGAVGAFFGFFASQVSDIKVELTSGFRDGSWGVAEGIFSFRYTGQLPGLPAGTGQEVANRFSTVFEFDGDLIRRSSDYYDNTGLLIAVGLLPGGSPPATPGA
ncbi:MAG TPA: nuclear transport factor 2 family protein [Thermomicrobiales bacterium]|jgi:steroid delta-isomerase-like uncharacterized protein|nr:nuclear transport factor 2 family protein [Thermomicrobiales bacterium]